MKKSDRASVIDFVRADGESRHAEMKRFIEDLKKIVEAVWPSK